MNRRSIPNPQNKGNNKRSFLLFSFWIFAALNFLIYMPKNGTWLKTEMNR